MCVNICSHKTYHTYIMFMFTLSPASVLLSPLTRVCQTQVPLQGGVIWVRVGSPEVVIVCVLQVKVTQEVKHSHTEQLNRLQLKHQTDLDFLEDLRSSLIHILHCF